MALPASDSFTGSNGTALQTYSANWSVVTGTLYINSNAVCAATSSNEGCARWSADAFDADQYAQATWISGTPGIYIGVAVRCSNTDATYYGVYTKGTGDTIVFKSIAGVYTELALTPITWVSGNTMRLEVRGTTLTFKRNGVTQSTTTDSAIASGWAGVCCFGNNTSARIDDWQAGNLSGFAPAMIARARVVNIDRWR